MLRYPYIEAEICYRVTLPSGYKSFFRERIRCKLFFKCMSTQNKMKPKIFSWPQLITR